MKNKKLLTLLLIIMGLFSCKQETVDDYSILETQSLEISLTPGYYPYEEYSGEDVYGNLSIKDINGNTYDFDIKNGINKIDVPFGYYTGVINGYKDYSSTNLEIIAIGASKEVSYYPRRISLLPEVKMDSFYFYESNETIRLKAHIISDDPLYRFNIWGSNDDGEIKKDIILVRGSQGEWKRNDSVSFYLPPVEQNYYKYYAISMAPWAGYFEDREEEYFGWHELNIEEL